MQKTTSKQSKQLLRTHSEETRADPIGALFVEEGAVNGLRLLGRRDFLRMSQLLQMLPYDK